MAFDLRLSTNQNMIAKVAAITAQSTQKLMDFRGQGAQGGKLDTGALRTAQIDVIALLGHTNYELSLRRREAIKPNLNKEYGSLCSSQTPVTTYSNGLAFCPRKFTKLMKPAYAVLRQLGHINPRYIDDSYLQGGRYE